MYLMLKTSHDLIDIQDLDSLLDPLEFSIVGRSQAGQEEQTDQEYQKSDLVFPSNEPLPACWTDSNHNPPYR